MRLSHCESYCASPLCYIPCIPKSKDAPAAGEPLSSAAAPCPVATVAAVAEDKPPPVQKIEVEPPAEKDGEKTLAAAMMTVAPPPPPKSNLKKANCAAADGMCAPKGNVKWLDLLGKDLTEVKEFEPSESGDSLDDGDNMSGCVCVIQ
uniref:Uncharacterized protein n=1 Tax=Avena sativa TaxID=4498 RepID=A0ACD5WEL0_AVESA